MPLQSTELLTLVPEVELLIKTLSESLRKDPDGKVRITKVEAKKICKLAAKIALHFTKDALD
jgi:hypothetical protein